MVNSSARHVQITFCAELNSPNAELAGGKPILTYTQPQFVIFTFTFGGSGAGWQYLTTLSLYVQYLFCLNLGKVTGETFLSGIAPNMMLQRFSHRYITVPYVSSLSQATVKPPHRLHLGRRLFPALLRPSSIHQGWRARPVRSPTPISAWTVPLHPLQSPLTTHLVHPPTAAASGVTPSPNHHAQKTQIAFWMLWASSWDREWRSLMTSWPLRTTMRR